MKRKTKGNSAPPTASTKSAPAKAGMQQTQVFGLIAMMLVVFFGLYTNMANVSEDAPPKQSSEQIKQKPSAAPKTAKDGSVVITKLSNRPKVVGRFEHDPTAFTQGLLVHNGIFYESTGMYGGSKTGPSDVRKVEIATGKVLQVANLDDKLFGEGMELWGDHLIQLTWREKVVLFWDPETLKLVKQVPMPPTVTNEGWGLAQNGTHLIVSDGSSWLFYWDPETLEEVQRQEVTYNGKPLPKLNELEFVDGFIFANVWYDDHLYVIDPATAKVVTRWNYKALHDQVRTGQEDCFNGIAYDKSNNRLYVTGKWWSKMFALDLAAFIS